MKIKFIDENNGLFIIFCRRMESQKLKTQKLKCYVLGPKSQKFPTAENTRYTVVFFLNLVSLHYIWDTGFFLLNWKEAAVM